MPTLGLVAFVLATSALALPLQAQNSLGCTHRGVECTHRRPRRGLSPPRCTSMRSPVAGPSRRRRRRCRPCSSSRTQSRPPPLAPLTRGPHAHAPVPHRAAQPGPPDRRPQRLHRRQRAGPRQPRADTTRARVRRARAARAHGVLRDEPYVGDVFLLYSRTRRRFIHTGIVVGVHEEERVHETSTDNGSTLMPEVLISRCTHRGSTTPRQVFLPRPFRAAAPFENGSQWTSPVLP